jgi:hypothetical protein
MQIKYVTTSGEEKIYDAPNGWRHDHGGGMSAFDADMAQSKLWGGTTYYVEDDVSERLAFELAEEAQEPHARPTIAIDEPGQVVKVPATEVAHFTIVNPRGFSFVVRPRMRRPQVSEWW